MALWCFGYQRALQTFPKQAAPLRQKRGPEVRPRPGRRAKPRPNHDQSRSSQGQTETTPKQIQTQRRRGAARLGRSGANQTGRNREKQPSASMGAAPPSGPDCRPPPHARCRAPYRPSRARDHDFSFGSPRKRRPICRQDSPRGGDDMTIDPAPERRFGMARRRWARGMAGAIWGRACRSIQPRRPPSALKRILNAEASARARPAARPGP